MVTIRLARFGSKKHAYYHVVVTHSENPRDGRFLEQVGIYDPSKDIKEQKILLDRVDHWLSVGAQPSTRVKHVLTDYRRAAASA